MANIGTLMAHIGVNTADLKRAEAEMAAFTRQARTGFARLIPMVTKTSAVLGILAAVVGIKSTKAFMDFEKQLRNVGTLLGDQAKVLMPRFQKEILGLNAALGSATDITRGLYQAISAGLPKGAEALEFVTKAAQAAQAGLSDVFTAVDAGTSVLNAFGMQAKESDRIFDAMFQTVKDGKTTFEALASGIGRVVTISAVAGVSMEEMFAALASLTKAGLSTDEAVTALRQTILTFLDPMPDAVEFAKQLGIELSASALKSRGLHSILGDLGKALGENAGLYAKVFSNVRALTGALPLASKLSADFAQNLKNQAEAAGAAAEAFSIVEPGLGHRIKTLGRTIQQALIPVGESIAIGITPVIEFAQAAAEWLKQTTAKLQGYTTKTEVLNMRIEEQQNRIKSLQEELDRTVKVAERYEAIDEFLGKAFGPKNQDRIKKIKEALVEARWELGNLQQDLETAQFEELMSGVPPAYPAFKPTKPVQLPAGPLPDSKEIKAAMDFQIAQMEILIRSETLTREERLAIWDAYEEKRREQINEEIKALKEQGVEKEVVWAYEKNALVEMTNLYSTLSSAIADIPEWRPTPIHPDIAAGLIKTEEQIEQWTSLREHFQAMTQDAEKAFDYMEQMSIQTARNMQNSFGSFFFKLVKGEFDSLLDVVKGFADAMIRIMADIAAQMAAQKLFGQAFLAGEGPLGGLLGSIGKALKFEEGGLVSEPIIGVGKSGKTYSIGEAGPELIIPMGNIKKRFGDGGVISEPVMGIGASGTTYLMGEKGPEWVIPALDVERPLSSAKREELTQNIYLVDSREDIQNLGPEDVVLLVSSDIAKGGVITRTIKTYL